MRTKEIAVRITFGAASSAILHMTFREALRLAAAGAGIGGFGALVVASSDSSNIAHPTSNIGHRASDIGHRASDIEHRAPLC